MTEYIVDFGNERSSAFVRLAMAQAEASGARLQEEIVRCRDCERFTVDQSDHEYRSGWWCHWWNTDMVKPDGFCAWGERKEVDE